MNHNQSMHRSNYGILTNFSKSLNDFFGDFTGRTVSHRTAQGFRHLFKVNGIDDEDAEHIVHASMIAAGACLKSKDEGTQTTGALLAFALILCYQAGK